MSFTAGTFSKQNASKNYQKKHQKIVIRGTIYLFFYSFLCIEPIHSCYKNSRNNTFKKIFSTKRNLK